jgi:hypothetical protein
MFSSIFFSVFQVTAVPTSLPDKIHYSYLVCSHWLSYTQQITISVKPVATRQEDTRYVISQSANLLHTSQAQKPLELLPLFVIYVLHLKQETTFHNHTKNLATFIFYAYTYSMFWNTYALWKCTFLNKVCFYVTCQFLRWVANRTLITEMGVWGYVSQGTDKLLNQLSDYQLSRNLLRWVTTFFNIISYSC